MNHAFSVAERTLLAVDHVLKLAMNQAWKQMCRDAARRGSVRRRLAEDEYGGSNICSPEHPIPIESDQQPD